MILFGQCSMDEKSVVKVQMHHLVAELKLKMSPFAYSRVPLMWTPKGRTKSVHISEPSTVVDTLSCGHLE